jgi:putative transposase
MFTKVQTAFKVRLYPSKDQINKINQFIGSSRFVYNYFLDYRIKAYKTENRSVYYQETSQQLTVLKQQSELSWLKEVDKFALQNSLKDLQTAFNNFFREHAKGNSKQGYPTFKKKHGTKQSYQTNLTNKNIEVDFEHQRIKLPKLKWVSFSSSNKHKTNPPDGKLMNVTISRTPSGKYMASMLFKVDTKEIKEPMNDAIGIDLGIKHFAILSDGTKVENPKYYRTAERRLRRLQRQLSRKTRGSQNYNKVKRKIACLHEYIANLRKDFLHKLSFQVVSENQVLCLEDLHVKGMVKNRKLAKSIHDCGWGMFKQFVTYKADWYGRQVVLIDRFYPSSKMCSHCQEVNPMLSLSERVWICPHCKTNHDRDENAASNVLDEGLRLLTVSV